MIENYLREKLGYTSRQEKERHLVLIWNLFLKPNLYFRMPKVASQSIAESVGNNTLVLPHSYSPHKIRKMLKLNPVSFKFTFVRHPFTRFSSAYRWATREEIDPNQYPFDIVQKNIVQAVGGVNEFCVALPELLKVKENHLIHFYPQSDYIYSSRAGRHIQLVDYFGKYEYLEKAIHELKARFNYELKVEFGLNRKSPNKFNRKDPMESFHLLGLNKRSIEILRQIYSSDFDLFSYE